jgi:hypothetical protein
MFVKFIECPEKGSGDLVRERIVECASYLFEYDKEDWMIGMFYFGRQLGGGGIIYSSESDVHVILHQTQVYIMSENGKTIDSYRWSKDEENKRCVRH